VSFTINYKTLKLISILFFILSYISAIKKFYRYCKEFHKIKNSDDFKQKEKELVHDPNYMIKQFRMIEVLFENFPQMILQTVLLYREYRDQGEIEFLQVTQIFNITFSLITISWSCMSYSKELAINRVHIKIRTCLFLMTRLISNMLLLVSRVIPLAFLINYFKWILLIALFRLIIFAAICFKFQIFDYNIDRRPVSFIKKTALSISFSVLKAMSFFEEFEFNLPYLLYNLVMVLENVIIYCAYLILSRHNIFEKEVYLKAFIVLGCMPLGLLIEMMYWRCCKPKFEKEKFDIRNISENFYFSLSI
jgi:hypothetical protein